VHSAGCVDGNIVIILPEISENISIRWPDIKALLIFDMAGMWLLDFLRG